MKLFKLQKIIQIIENNGPVPIKHTQTLPRSEVAIFTWKMPTVLNWMKNQFSDFYFSRNDGLYLQFTGDTP